MTTIEELREKFGDSPTPIRGLAFESDGHAFKVYMVSLKSGTSKTKAQITLRDGSNVEIDVDTPVESDEKNRWGYFKVSPDKPNLLFFDSEKHVSDYLECRKTYEDRQARIIKDFHSGLKDEELKLKRAQKKYDDLYKALEKARASFNLGFLTDARNIKLNEYSAEIQKWELKIKARERGPSKPEKSYLTAIRMNAPVRVAFPGGFVDPANSLRAELVRKYGITPTLPQQIGVVGLVRSEVTLRP